MRNTLISLSVGVGALALAAAIVVGACIPEPRMHHSRDQLLALDNTKELMRTMYHEMRPVWKADKKSTYDAADFRYMALTASRVLAASEALRSKEVRSRFPKGFATRAKELGQHATALAAAAAASKQSEAHAAIQRIKTTCERCHKKYR